MGNNTLSVGLGVNDGSCAPPLYIRENEASEEKKVMPPYFANFPQEGRYYVPDREIKRCFLDRAKVPIDLVFSKAGIDSDVKKILGKRCRLVSLEELSQAQQNASKILRERALLEKEKRLNRKRDNKLTLGDALKELDLKKIDNIAIYKSFRDLSKAWGITFPEDLSKEYFVTRAFADNLKKEIEKNPVAGEEIEISFKEIYEIESLKNENPRAIALKTGEDEAVIENVMQRLGYKLPFNGNNGGIENLLPWKLEGNYRFEDQFDKVQKFKNGYLVVLEDLILFGANSAFPGVIGHVAKSDYRKAIKNLKEGKENRVEGSGIIEVKGIGSQPYSKAKITLINEKKIKRFFNKKREEFFPSYSFVMALRNLEKLC